MTDFQPTPQTPEQVDEGLRNAFRQAKEDGVMDATPYLNIRTFITNKFSFRSVDYFNTGHVWIVL